MTCQQLPAVERDRFKCVLSKLWMELVAAAASVGFCGGEILYRPRCYRLLRLLPAPPFKGVCRAQLFRKEAWPPSPGRGRL